MVRAIGLCLAALLGQLLLALEQLLELQLVEVEELLGEAATVGDPLADGRFQGAGNVQQDPSIVVSDSQIQGTVQLAALAATGGFAAGARLLYQGTAQEGLLGDQLDDAASRVAFRRRAG